MKKIGLFLVVGLLGAGHAFALTSVRKSLQVFSARYAFQGEGDGLLPANEAVADYLESLPKGSSFIAKMYSCDVKASKGVLAAGGSLVQLDMLYDVSNCTTD